MAGPVSDSGRERHVALFALVLGLCLVAVVAAAAGSWAPLDGKAGGSRRFLILTVLVVIAVVWLAVAVRLAGAQAAWVLRVFAGVSVLSVGAAVLAAVAIGLFWGHSVGWSPWSCRCGMGLPWGAGGGGKAQKGAPGGNVGRHHTGSGNGEAMIVEASIAAGGAVLLACLAAYRARRRRRRFGEDVVSPLLVFVDESVEDLRREADVRRAIEACYARMERTLGRAGLVRGRAEAPLEYLERTSVRFGVARGSLERLTGLFEEAKFSRHALGEPTREEAIDALLALRAEATA